MHAERAEGTARAAQGVTVSQTAARPLTSAAYATEAASPRAPAIVQETCWTNAGYSPKVLMCEDKRTHRGSRISVIACRSTCILVPTTATTRVCSWSRMLSFVIISRVFSFSLCLTHTHTQTGLRRLGHPRGQVQLRRRCGRCMRSVRRGRLELRRV